MYDISPKWTCSNISFCFVRLSWISGKWEYVQYVFVNSCKDSSHMRYNVQITCGMKYGANAVFSFWYIFLSNLNICVQGGGRTRKNEGFYERCFNKRWTYRKAYICVFLILNVHELDITFKIWCIRPWIQGHFAHMPISHVGSHNVVPHATKMIVQIKDFSGYQEHSLWCESK